MLDPFEIQTTLTSGSKKPLDWEEAAVDSNSSINELHDSDRAAPGLKWLAGALLTAFLMLAGRIFYLQIIQGASFRALSDNNRVRSQTILAPRGLVTDRSGQVLTQNTASFNLVATPF